MKRNGLLLLMATAVALFSCKKKGCTDPSAINYSVEAEKDDGNCQYQTDATNAY